MSKERWFKHYADASEHPSILSMELAFGHAGYAFFFKLNEKLVCRPDHRLPADEELLSRLIGFPPEQIKQMLSKCYSLGLYRLFDDSTFTSESLLHQLHQYDEIRAKRIEAGREGGLSKGANFKKKIANAKQVPSKRNSKCLAKGIEGKKEEKKEDKSTDLTTPAETYIKVRENIYLSLPEREGLEKDFSKNQLTYLADAAEHFARKKGAGWWKEWPRGSHGKALRHFHNFKTEKNLVWDEGKNAYISANNRQDFKSIEQRNRQERELRAVGVGSAAAEEFRSLLPKRLEEK